MRRANLLTSALALALAVGVTGAVAADASKRPPDGVPPRPPPPSRESPRAPLGAPGPCGPLSVPVGQRCLALAGTTWRLETSMPEGPRVFEIDLLPGGRLHSRDPADQTTDNDEWGVDVAGLRFWFNDRFVVHRVVMDGERAFHGETLNVNGLRWTFRATRVR